MNTVMKSMVDAELVLREYLIKSHKNFYARLKDEKGDVPGWVLVVLMTTGLVTAIAILKNSLDSMNGIR